MGGRDAQPPDEPLPLWWRVFAFVWLRVSFAIAAFGSVLMGSIVIALATQLPTFPRAALMLAAIALAPVAYIRTKRLTERWHVRLQRQLEGAEQAPVQLGGAGASTPVGVSAAPADAPSDDLTRGRG